MTNPLVSLLLRPLIRRKFAQELVITSATGIVTQRFVPIGGIEQWMSIRGEDRNNPVLLLLHGGPASPYSIFSPMLRSWEKYFTIVQWDQRGAGKTLRKNANNGIDELSFERLAQDAIEVIEYLCHSLTKEKVILVGSSVGSITGVIVAQRRPDLLYAYVGTDQNCAENLACSYQLTRDWLHEAGNQKGIEAVEALWRTYPDWTSHDLNQFNQWMLKAGASKGVPNFGINVVLPAMLTSPNHTFSDLKDITTGMKISLDKLVHELLSFKVRALGLSFNVPFFIFQGDNDIITPTASAKAYFEDIQAPQKAFALIKDSGHLAAFTRPEQFLRELLVRVRPFSTPLQVMV